MIKEIQFDLMLTEEEAYFLEDLARREYRGVDDQVLYLLNAYLSNDVLLPAIEWSKDGRELHSKVTVRGDNASLLVESSIMNRRSVSDEGTHIVACYLIPRCVAFSSVKYFKRFAKFSRNNRKSLKLRVD